MIQRPQQDSPPSPAAKESGERGVSLLTPLRYSSSPSFLIGGDEEEGILKVPASRRLPQARPSRVSAIRVLFYAKLESETTLSTSEHHETIHP